MSPRRASTISNSSEGRYSRKALMSGKWRGWNLFMAGGVRGQGDV